MDILERGRLWYDSLGVWQQTLFLFVIVVGFVTVIYTGLILSIHHPNGPERAFDTERADAGFWSYESPTVDTSRDFVIRASSNSSLAKIKYDSSDDELLVKTSQSSSRWVQYLNFTPSNQSYIIYSRMDSYEMKEEGAYPLDEVASDSFATDKFSSGSCVMNNNSTAVSSGETVFDNASAYESNKQKLFVYYVSLSFQNKFLYTPLQSTDSDTKYTVGESYFWAEGLGPSDVQVMHLEGSGSAEITESGQLSSMDVQLTETVYDAYYVGSIPIVFDTEPQTDTVSLEWNISYEEVDVEPPSWTEKAASCKN